MKGSRCQYCGRSQESAQFAGSTHCAQPFTVQPHAFTGLHPADIKEAKALPTLIVTKDGVPFADQAEGVRQFKEACLQSKGRGLRGICNNVLRLQGKAYPRTCAVHGLGPCEPKVSGFDRWELEQRDKSLRAVDDPCDDWSYGYARR